MIDYAAIQLALREYRKRLARKAAADKVAGAIKCYPWDHEPYYRLNIEAGIPVTGGPTEHQKELARLLQEVSNDGSENERTVEIPHAFCGTVAEEQEAAAADVPAGSRV